MTPGAFGLGWFLLAVGFLLALVSFFLKGTRKAVGVWALVLSIVGSIVGGIVFAITAVNAIDDALSGETTVSTPSGGTGNEGAAESPAEPEAGSRENPLPIGSAVSTSDWTVTVNSVTRSATDAVMSGNEFNEAPEDGYEYILVNATMTYTGADSSVPAVGTAIDYVTADGVTINAWDSFAVPEDALDSTTEVYTDGSVSGNVALSVPSATAGDGVLAVRAGFVADPVFVAVQ
ncbi:DUF4352 domain-containing protein [Microbacterium marinilacus]|nr:DUF4352 domain-containing protein [Microbacterium marinilacus]